ncbi:MAG: peptidoglycan DD-metalloendopeptidase family protein [Aquisalimonadaceae bacterium]
MRGSRLTYLDYKPGRNGGMPKRRRHIGRRLLTAMVAFASCAVILAFARSPEPTEIIVSAELPDTEQQTTDTQPNRNPDQPTARNGRGRTWQPGPFLDLSLPMPNHHDSGTGEPLLIQEITRLAPPPEPPFEVVTVRSGDSLAAIFKRAGLSPQELHRVVNTDERIKALTRIYPGDEIHFRLTENKQLSALRYQLDQTRTLVVNREGDDFSVDIEEQTLETRVLHTAGVIDRSFFLAGRQSGLSHGQLMQFMSIFEWQVDFNRDIRAGDAFSVVYEAEYLNGERVRDGRILAAKLINRDRRMNALHFELPDGSTGYFGPDGENMRKAFLRRPIQSARISSGFSHNRKHPVLGVRRPHLGTDFAAPTGTAIMASGSGRVIHRGRKGGYGHTVIIQHSNQYRTLYAHLSRYADGLKAGSRVEQGQIIGYVGRSGLASGPHLHYEFLVNGNHFNPMTVNLPSGAPVPEEHMADFQARTSGLLARVQVATHTELAVRDDD